MPAKQSPFDYRQTAGFYFSAMAKVEGEMVEHEDIVIDCQFNGKIQTSGFCEISENSNLQGEIKAKGITILGNADGEFYGQDNIAVKKSAKIRGILITPKISIDSGAQVNARIKSSVKNVDTPNE